MSFGNIKSLTSLKIDFDTREEREHAFSKIIISPKFIIIFYKLPVI